MRAATKRGRGHGQRASGSAGLAARQFAGSRRPRPRSRLGRDAARSIAAIAEGSVRSGSGESPSREPRRRRIFERCASSGRAREAVSRDVPGCRRGRNRPGTWSPPCRDRGRCPAGRRRCPRPCPSSGTSGPSCRCPCRAGRGWRRAGGARRGRPRRPGTKERGIRGERVSAERVRIERDARVARARRRDAAPVSSHRGIFFSRQRPKPSKARSRSRAIARARSAPARTLATGTAMVLMVTADMMSFCCER